MRKKHTHYHKDGTVWAKGYMNAGKMDGYWEWFRKDGSKMRTGHFKLGKQVGEWVTYDKHGKLVNASRCLMFARALCEQALTFPHCIKSKRPSSNNPAPPFPTHNILTFSSM